MLKDLIDWLYRLFVPPCLHEWEKVAELRDRPKNATAATIIRMCKHCGDVTETTFRRPKGDGEEGIVCPPHKWKAIKTTNVFSAGRSPKNGDLPERIDWTLQCEKCGDLTIRKGAEG